MEKLPSVKEKETDAAGTSNGNIGQGLEDEYESGDTSDEEVFFSGGTLSIFILNEFFKRT